MRIPIPSESRRSSVSGRHLYIGDSRNGETRSGDVYFNARQCSFAPHVHVCGRVAEEDVSDDPAVRRTVTLLRWVAACGLSVSMWWFLWMMRLSIVSIMTIFIIYRIRFNGVYANDGLLIVEFELLSHVFFLSFFDSMQFWYDGTFCLLWSNYNNFVVFRGTSSFAQFAISCILKCIWTLLWKFYVLLAHTH